MKMGGVGGFEVKQDFTAMGARRLHVILLCVCNDLSSVEGAMEFTKRKTPLKLLGRTTHV
jgi:hypothetical protein